MAEQQNFRRSLSDGNRAIVASRWIAAWGIVAFTTVGCGDSHGRMAVSGKVSLNGMPVDRGDISFSPLDGATFGGGAPIENGSYRLTDEKGLPAGKYLVRISSSVVEQRGNVELGFAPAPKAIAAKELIPAEYNTKSDQSIEVTAAGPNQFDFEITSRARNLAK